MLHVQSLSRSLTAAREQLQQARRGFEALVAYFGENPVALQNDGDFWRDVTAFVTAFSAAQQGALDFKKVCSSILSAPASSSMVCQALLQACTSGSAGLKAILDNR